MQNKNTKNKNQNTKTQKHKTKKREDTDLAMAYAAAGYEVRYTPSAVVLHDEGGSLSAQKQALMEENRRKFSEKWRLRLEARHCPPGTPLAAAADRLSVGGGVVAAPDADAAAAVISAPAPALAGGDGSGSAGDAHASSASSTGSTSDATTAVAVPAPAPVSAAAASATHHPTHPRGRLLWVDDIVPEPDRDSGSVRTLNALRILIANGYRVSYQPTAGGRESRYLVAARALGVDVLPLLPPDQWRLRGAAAAAFGPRGGGGASSSSSSSSLTPFSSACLYDAIVVARFYVYERAAAALRSGCPGTPLVFDTVDVHFLREARMALSAEAAAASKLAAQAEATVAAARALGGGGGGGGGASSDGNAGSVIFAPGAVVAGVSAEAGEGSSGRSAAAASWNFHHTDALAVVSWLDGGSPAAAAARRTRDREIALVRASTVTVVVSEVELPVLRHYAPGARLAVVSNVHDVDAVGAGGGGTMGGGGQGWEGEMGGGAAPGEEAAARRGGALAAALAAAAASGKGKDQAVAEAVAGALALSRGVQRQQQQEQQEQGGVLPRPLLYGSTTGKGGGGAAGAAAAAAATMAATGGARAAAARSSTTTASEEWLAAATAALAKAEAKQAGSSGGGGAAATTSAVGRPAFLLPPASASSSPTAGPPREGRACADRSGVLFVGNFNHLPNQQAVRTLLDDVLPAVADVLAASGGGSGGGGGGGGLGPSSSSSNLVLHIVGSNRAPDAALHGARVTTIFHGWLSDAHLRLLYGSVKVVVAPLLSGAGVKGKINQAMLFGVPVVATPVAAEGMHLADGVNALVAASPREFAERTLRAYTDCALWERLAEGGRANIRDYYSMAAAERGLLAVMAEAGAPAPGRRGPAESACAGRGAAADGGAEKAAVEADTLAAAAAEGAAAAVAGAAAGVAAAAATAAAGSALMQQR